MFDDKKAAIIIFSCPDKPGIVTEVSQFIFKNSGNILQSDQHKDFETSTFFMRIEWDLENFTLDKNQIYNEFLPIANKFEMKWSLSFNTTKKRVAIFVSKFDHCLYELLIRNKAGELFCEIVQIISNHQECKKIADYFNIPFTCYEVTKDNKKEIEEKQIIFLKAENIDLIILARYMQILSDNFINNFPDKIINIHHSFLPAFVGAKPYHQAFMRGVKLIGATSHYVTEDLDEGPIIEQAVERISHRDPISQLVLKGKNLEKLVLAKAVKFHLEDRILVFKNRTIVFE